ncbi:MAG: hypothetical protein ACOY4T_05760, partial [Pseudomonadota bacterium]
MRRGLERAFALGNGVACTGDRSPGDRIAAYHVLHGVKGFGTCRFLNAAIFAVRDRNRQSG